MADKGMLITRARAMRKQPSRAERAVWDVLRDRRMGVKFRRQFPIDTYIADFACVEAKLIVEIDGASHDVREQVAYDATLSALGWRVVRVRDALVLADVREGAALIQKALAP